MAIDYVTGLCYTQSNGKKRYDETNSFLELKGTVIDNSNIILATYNYLDQKIGSGGVGDKNTQYLRYWGPYDKSVYTYIGTSNYMSSTKYYAQPFIAGIGKNASSSNEEERYKEYSKWGEAFCFNFNKNTTNKTLSRSILFGFLLDYNSSEKYFNRDFGATICIQSQYSDDGPLNDTLELNDFNDVNVGSNHIKYYKITHEITYSEDSHKQLDDVIPTIGDPVADVYFQLNYLLFDVLEQRDLNFIYQDSTIILNFGCFFTDQYNTEDGTHLDSAFDYNSSNFITISGNPDDYSWEEIRENTHYRRKSRKNSGQVDIYIDLNSTKITIEFSNMTANEIQNTIFDSTFNLESKIVNKNYYGPSFNLNFTI